jgi:hypothetical protein
LVCFPLLEVAGGTLVRETGVTEAKLKFLSADAAAARSHAQEMVTGFAAGNSARSEEQEENAGGERHENHSAQDTEEQGRWRRRNGARRALRGYGRIQHANAGVFAGRAARTSRRRGWLELEIVFGEFVGHAENTTPLRNGCLEEAEDSFDGDPGGDGAASGVARGNKFPGADGFRGAFIEAEADSLDDADLRGPAVGAHQNSKCDFSLYFCLASLVGILRVRAVRTLRESDAGLV